MQDQIWNGTSVGGSLLPLWGPFWGILNGVAHENTAETVISSVGLGLDAVVAGQLATLGIRVGVMGVGQMLAGEGLAIAAGGIMQTDSGALGFFVARLGADVELTMANRVFGLSGASEFAGFGVGLYQQAGALASLGAGALALSPEAFALSSSLALAGAIGARTAMLAARLTYNLGDLLPNGMIAGVGPGAQFVGEGSLYDVGTYNQLRYNAIPGTIIHHVVSRLRGAELIPDYATDSMAGTEFGIRLPISEADAVDLAATMRTGIPASAREELAWQIQELRQYTNAPNSALQRLIELNVERRESDFVKGY